MPNDQPGFLVDELTFRAYAHNRALDPTITAEQWAKVWPNAAAMEKRYQRELAAPPTSRAPMVIEGSFWNAGARMADDLFCQGCGVRGTVLCGACQ